MLADGFDPIRCHNVLAGTLVIEESLPRLAGIVSDPSGRIHYVAAASVEDGRTLLVIRAQGNLSLICQRCLGALSFDMDLHNRLLLIGKNGVWPDDNSLGGLEDESCDVIEVEGELDLKTILEEEILLALPISPRHEFCESLATARALSSSPSVFSKLS